MAFDGHFFPDRTVGTASTPVGRTGAEADSSLADFDAVYVQHYPAVYRAIRAVVLDPALAEDVTQETFIRALRKRHLFRDGSNVGAWLHTMGVRQALSTIRWKGVQRRLLSSLTDATRQPKAAPETSDLATELLATLKPKVRAAVVLHHHHGYRYREVADILGIPEGTVATRIANALRQMRTRAEEIGRSGGLDL